MNIRNAVFAVLLLFGATAIGAEEKVKPALLKTPAGIEFGLLGAKPTAPAPTVFIFAADIDRTLTDPAFNSAGMLLGKRGFLCVALDAPCHGKDARENHASELSGWRERIEQGNDLVGAFSTRCSQVLDYLIAEGYTDATRVAAVGTSRGGFLAIHFAAAEPRVRCVVGFAPVTNLMALSEFAGTTSAPVVQKLSLTNVADKLVGRPIWVSIGNDDQRVGTDDAIAFTRAIVRASRGNRGPDEVQPPVPVELHVMPSRGHAIHPDAHAEAAAWIARVIERR
jgi:dienelactone hydrolase